MITITACGGGTGTPTPPDASTPIVTIAPAEANVMTCSTRQFTTNDTAATPGTWSVDRGAISTGGLYTSPLTVPSSPVAAVSYAPVSGVAAHATAHLATAFPATPSTIDTGFANDATPFEHVLSMTGQRVYAVFPGSADTVRILRSDNGGASFTAKPALAMPGVHCATGAVDAGNPDVLYVVAHHAAGSETSVTVHVSEDGGATFPHRYVIADSILGGLATALCPDIASPSADHVVVTTAAQDDNQTMSWAAIYASADRGASFGTGAGTNSADHYSPTDVNRTALFTTGTVLSDGGQNGPRAFSDGKGHMCTSYAVDGASGCEAGGCNSVVVQCSANAGATWSTPKVLGVTGTSTFPTGAISPAGDIAITWTQRVSGVATIEVAFSTDGGATFSAPIAHPFDAATFGYTDLPVVAWQGRVLWLQQTTAASDQPLVVIDKTCDFGASWSGALPITAASDYLGEALLVTPTSVAAIGRGLRDATNRPLSLIQLSP